MTEHQTTRSTLGLGSNQPLTRAPRFPIGQQFTTRGKAPRVCTVVDILRTYNAAGDLVRLRYVATHTLLGQTITENDVSETSHCYEPWTSQKQKP